MSLPSIHLDAFVAVAKFQNFSRAAKQLHITQSALSQRIKNLEDMLNITLIIRETTGIRLTDSGTRLLRYCQIRDVMEEELTSDLSYSVKGELAGILRIGAYSSVMESVVLPALTPLLRKHPNIQCEFVCKSVKELPELLERSKVDFIVMDYQLERHNIETIKLGVEEYVEITSSKYEAPQNLYLDNDFEDRATENFFKFQKIKRKYKRSYMSDCYGILEGVSAGLGYAIMPKHLVDKNRPVKIVEGYKPYQLGIYLHYFHQPFYTKLQGAAISQLTDSCQKFLSRNA
jgi:DNA-binding transcriptional LysR family regulator